MKEIIQQAINAFLWLTLAVFTLAFLIVPLVIIGFAQSFWWGVPYLFIYCPILIGVVVKIGTWVDNYTTDNQ